MTRCGKLELFINGQSEGFAASGIPTDCPSWAVVDMYGTCQKISIATIERPLAVDDPIELSMLSSIREFQNEMELLNEVPVQETIRLWVAHQNSDFFRKSTNSNFF